MDYLCERVPAHRKADPVGKSQSLTRREREQIAQARAHPVAWLLRKAAYKFGSVESTPTHWLQSLNTNADDRARQSKEWPRTVNQLGRAARVLRPGLLLLDVEITFRRRGNARLFRIETTEAAARRRHYEATKPEREAARITRIHEDRAVSRAINDHTREMQRQQRRKKH